MSSFRTVNSFLNTSAINSNCLNKYVINLNKLCQFSKLSSTYSFNKLNLVKNQIRTKTDQSKSDLSSYSAPLNIKKNDKEDFNEGEEIVGKKLNPVKITKVINDFYQRKSVRTICQQNGIDDNLIRKGFISFRNYCLNTNKLPAELYVVLNDIIEGNYYYYFFKVFK